MDIYLTGNQVGNKLYLNRGGIAFEDITEASGTSCNGIWNTGATMADVNGDGLLDIFVCKSGPIVAGARHNQLFINNGDLTFTDRAKQFGIADVGLSIQAAFFDYDKDGDLDVYLSSNSSRPIGFFDLYEGQRNVRDSAGGNKLYKNIGEQFVDVSEEAGIYGSAIGYGLGVSIADINNDKWPDIFVSNDFFEKDYLYINQKDGKFKELSEVSMKSLSLGSMGADIADLNNDGYPEIFVTEMLPSRNELIKSKIAFENYNKYEENVKRGFYHQFNRNMLQLNMGPILSDSDEVTFSEIGRFSHVEATNWSWSGLIFDYDNDGLRDIFVSNGIAKDLLDQDYITYYAPSILNDKQLFEDSTILLKLMDKMPTTPSQKVLFKHAKDFQFTDVSDKVGINLVGFSNGAAYGDLNNDGSLDLVINSINQPASIYQGISGQNKSANFLQLILRDHDSKNRFAIGAKVIVYSGDRIFYNELFPVRGYLSSIDYKLHFGLGEVNKIDSIKIEWPTGLPSVGKNIEVNSCEEITRMGGQIEIKKLNKL